MVTIRNSTKVKNSNTLKLSFLLVMLIINVLTNYHCSAQWKAVSYTTKVEKKYQLASQILPLDSFYLGFPECGMVRSIQLTDKQTSKKIYLKSILKHFQWDTNYTYELTHKFEESVAVNTDIGRLSLNIHTGNVGQLIIAFKSPHWGWIAKEFSILSDGYQLPIYSYLLSWDTKQEIALIPNQTIYLDELVVMYRPQRPNESSILTIGQLELQEYHSHYEGKVIPWVADLVGNSSDSYAKIFNDYSQWTMNKIASAKHNNFSIPSFEDFGLSRGYITGLTEFKTNNQAQEEHILLHKLIKKAVELYPYYKEKRLDKKAICYRIDSLFRNRHTDNTEFLTCLKECLNREFSDPHFELILNDTGQKNDKELSQGPLRLERIANDIVVAAVFNPAYQVAVPLGSKVDYIDEKPVSNFLSTKKLANVLKKPKTDTLSLSIFSQSYDSTYKVSIPYDQPVVISDNFRPKHGELKILADSTIYLRLNNWTGDAYYQFINNRQKIIASKKLIIDLRNNGGGYSTDVYKVLSLFINQPRSIGYLDYPWFKESITVLPSYSHLGFCDKISVVILTDDNTACASEIFILGMKKFANALVIGNAYTAGAIASPTLFRFPSGLIVKMHSIIRKFQFDPDLYVEGQGIEPDVWVSKTHARDLYPYEDKVLKMATLMFRSR